MRYHAGLAELAASEAIEIPHEPAAGHVANGHIFYLLADKLATRMALAAHLTVLVVAVNVPGNIFGGWCDFVCI